MKAVTADELYDFICANAEEINGEIICRASVWKELERRGVPEGPQRQQLRVRLVKELEAQGLIKRVHPRSRYLVILRPPNPLQQKVRAESRRRFEERMAFDAIELIPPRFGADRAAASARRRKLRSYFDRNVMRGKDFICSSWRECEGSVGKSCVFTEGQLSHVGKYFDLTRDEHELRVVVVGQEVGGRGNARITMAERSKGVHQGSGLTRRLESEPGRVRRNPHMRGTTLALREIFGLPPTGDHDDEFLDIDGDRVHMFDCFALVNRLLCAAHELSQKTGKRTSSGDPTPVMLGNCERHLRATLEILEPTLVVVQGVKVWRWSQEVLVPIKNRGKGLWECELAGRSVLVAPFTHPTAWPPNRWDSPSSLYFREVVSPSLRRARRLALQGA